MILVALIIAVPQIAADGIASSRPPSVMEGGLWIAVAAVAAVHRPLGGTGLGLGTLVLPAVIVRFGGLMVVLVAALARLLASALWRFADRRRNATHRISTEFAAAVIVALAALLAAVAWSKLTTVAFVWRGLAAAAVYVATFAALAQLGDKIRHPVWRRVWPGLATLDLAALALDATGWLLGALLADAAATLGWPRVAPILVALALLAAEAARNAFARGASDVRVDDFERLQRAHERILSETSGMGSIAQQIFVECSNILPVEWYQFELVASEEPGQLESEPGSWWAGPSGVLEEGQPQPATRPRMLPGVHRRVTWHILERSLVVEGEPLATVRLWCDPRRIDSGAEELFSTLVPQMASSVHRARLDREARLDPLTGVPVRRILDSGMQRAYRRCCEEGRSMGVIMCDVDHFKNVNDTYGHAAGDEALICVARALESARREHDLLARYGGEEFTLLLEDTGGEAALQLAERLRRAVESIDLVYEGQPIPLALSAGVAAFPELHIKTVSELLLLADEALYEAKESGRNRCLLNCGPGVFQNTTGQRITSQSMTGPTPGVEDAALRLPPRIFG